MKYNSYRDSNGPGNIYAVHTHRNQLGPETLVTPTNAQLLQSEPVNAHNFTNISVMFNTPAPTCFRPHSRHPQEAHSCTEQLYRTVALR